MATIERTVELIFAGVDRTTPVLSGISSSLTGLGDLAETVASPISRVTDAVLAADAALAALGASLVAVSVDQAGRFADGFRGIATLVDASGADLERFRGEILAYSRDSTASLEEVNEATYQAISLGVDYRSALEAVGAAERLAVAGKAELASTLELLVGTLNAYGLGVEEAGRVSDVFFTAVRDGKTTIPELAASLSQVTGVASAAGVPVETLAAAVAALTAAGLPTSQAITGLKAALSNILKPSEQARDLAEELGVGFDVQALAARGLEGVLADVNRATGGNVDSLGKLFGSVEGLNAALVLGQDRSGIFAKALSDMAASAGATQAAYEKMADSFALVNQRVANNVRATLVQIGLPLLDQYGETAAAVTEVLRSIGSSIDAGDFAPLFDALNQAGAALQAFLSDLARALPDALAQVDWDPLIDGLRSLGHTLAGVFDGLDLTQPDQLAQAIQRAVDTLGSLARATEGIALAFRPVADAVAGAIAAFNSLSDDQKVQIGRDLLGTAKLVTSAGAEITGALLVLGDGAERWGERFRTALHLTGSAAQAFVSLWNLASAGIAKSLQVIVDALDTLTLGRIPGIDRLADQLGQIASGEFADYLEAARGARDHLEALAAAALDAGPPIDTMASHVSGLGRELDLVASHAQGAAGATGETAAEMAELERILGGVASELNAQIGATRAAGDAQQALAAALPSVAGGLDEVAGGSRDAGRALQTAGRDSEDFRLQIARLQADLAKTDLQLSVDLQTARLQADTDRVKAAFQSISDVVGDTGDQITDLFQQLSGAMATGNIHLQNQIQDALRREEARRAQQFQQQQALIQAQIDALTLRNQILQQGGGLIQIDATGVEPALELVMWQILEKVQLRVNESAAEFLLGVGV